MSPGSEPTIGSDDQRVLVSLGQTDLRRLSGWDRLTYVSYRAGTDAHVAEHVPGSDPTIRVLSVCDRLTYVRLGRTRRRDTALVAEHVPRLGVNDQVVSAWDYQPGTYRPTWDSRANSWLSDTV